METQPLPSNSQRFDSLDGLRAIACLFVIWQHVSESFVRLSSGGTWATETASYFDFGRIGVVAFFCISGFVIPNSLRGPRLAGTRRFVLNRFFRLYPIYWLSIPLAIYVTWYLNNRTIDLPTILGNLTMAMTFQGTTSIQGLYWTLEIELLFYILCAVLYLVFGNLRLPVIAAAFLLCNVINKRDIFITAPGGLPFAAYFLSIMLAAAALRCAFDLKPDTDKWIRAIHWVAAALMFKIVLSPVYAAVVKSFSLEDPIWNKYGYGHTVGIALFLIVIFLPWKSAWLAKLGRATYSAYLLHAIVFYGILKIWKINKLPQTRMELYILLAAVITFAIALLSYKFIELPTIRLAKKLTAPK